MIFVSIPVLVLMLALIAMAPVALVISDNSGHPGFWEAVAVACLAADLVIAMLYLVEALSR